jgi:hypothetical protein
MAQAQTTRHPFESDGIHLPVIPANQGTGALDVAVTSYTLDQHIMAEE